MNYVIPEFKVVERLGYAVTRNRELITKLPLCDEPERVLKERRDYHLTPYRKREEYRTILYDYYKDQEYYFDSPAEVMGFLNVQEPLEVVINRSKLDSALYITRKSKVTQLLKGYGLSSDNLNLEWFNYREEAIVSNRYGCLAPMAVYEWDKGESKVLITGRHSLCKALGFKIDGSETYSYLKSILKSFDLPSLKIRRLSSPIFSR